MTPPTTWARAEITREGGTLKPRTPSSITQLLVELTTQISVPRSVNEETRECISGKILSGEARLEKCGSGPADFQFTQAVVDLDHFPAHGEFRDLAGTIEPVAGVDPVARVAGDDALFDRPDHEVVSGVSVPQRSVAVEDGNGGLSGENRIGKFFGGKRRDMWLDLLLVKRDGRSWRGTGPSSIVGDLVQFCTPRREQSQVNLAMAVSLGS